LARRSSRRALVFIFGVLAEAMPNGFSSRFAEFRYRVERAVGSPKNDSPNLVEPTKPSIERRAPNLL
jgi:hypothetical protein